MKKTNIILGLGILLLLSGLSSGLNRTTLNTTTSLTWTAFDISSLVLVVLAAIVIIAVVLILSSPRMLKKWKKLREFLLQTFNYFFYGAGMLLALGSIYYVLDALRKDISKGGPMLKPLALTIVGFFAVSALGYVVKNYAVDRIAEAWEQVEEEEDKK